MSDIKQSSMKQNFRTSELLRRLFKTPDFAAFLEENKDSVHINSFVEHLERLCADKNMIREHVIKRAGIERSFGHQIFRGSRQPSRDNVIRLAFGFSLSVDETQELLKIARKSALYPKIKRDAIILFGLSHKKTMIDMQNIISENELTLLGGEKYDYGEL